MNQKQGDGTLLSSELARLTGVSTDTLRHYERMGLLAPPQRTLSGYRRYPPEALERVKMVRQALAVGFSLAELSAFLRVRSQGGAPCKDVRALAAVKIREMDRQLTELKRAQDRLRTLLKAWDARLAVTPKGERACLLDSLAPPNRPIKIRKGANR